MDIAETEVPELSAFFHGEVTPLHSGEVPSDESGLSGLKSHRRKRDLSHRIRNRQRNRRTAQK